MTTIPNAVTNEQLFSALKEIKEAQPALFDGKTLEQVNEYLAKCGPDYNKEFRTDAPLVNKMHIINELTLLYNHHKRNAEPRDEHSEKEAEMAQAWEHDAQQLLLMIWKLSGIYLDDKDPNYREADITTAFVGEMGEESLQVMRHFGLDAPRKLNTYSTILEDVLIDKHNENHELKKEIAALKGEPEPEPTDVTVLRAELNEKQEASFVLRNR